MVFFCEYEYEYDYEYCKKSLDLFLQDLEEQKRYLTSDKHEIQNKQKSRWIICKLGNNRSLP